MNLIKRVTLLALSLLLVLGLTSCGASGPEDERTVGQALQQYPLAFALATADMEASYFLEGK